MSDNVQRALAVVRGLAAGSLDKTRFTPDASWWAVTGERYPLDSFLAILAMLHEKTIGGIVVDTGHVIDGGDSVVIEGTSDVPLVDGGRYANRYLFLIHLRDGLVSEVREYNDAAHVTEAFGLAG